MYSEVTPYIPRVDGVKNSLAGACELFHNYANSHKDYDCNLVIATNINGKQ